MSNAPVVVISISDELPFIFTPVAPTNDNAPPVVVKLEALPAI